MIFLVEDGVILVTGGDAEDISVEALNSNGTRLCDMPDLPDKRSLIFITQTL